ncbi:membrane dipeptidase [uncultured Mucilaginibacter sp.]|uniref:dipeptidase n=1 Tax=uncultured Mucilaginibacter sp. TaxID=797541 RepID=UPI002627C4D1|nr:membrane dipeptidase [uncultured Mucilaginibacter sp.]
MFIVDAHLDLSMNALEWNRDLTQTVAKINAREKGLNDKPDRGNAVVALPELRRGNVGLVVATQIARYVAPGNPLPGWHSPEQAWAQTQGQLAWYKAMEYAGEMVQVNDLDSLNRHLDLWETASTEKKPIGYILSLEGADSILSMQHLDQAYEDGLRAVGPAHYGPGRYAQGTDATGFMGEKGHELLRQMEKLNIILDATHLCDDSFWEALNHFNGAVWASHNNCRALVNHNRQYSDEQIKVLIERGAVIGAAMDAWMLIPNWERGKSDPKGMHCDLNVVIDHIDHICQIAGNCLHVGIGSDLDGAFGREQCPYDLETIANLQKLDGLLALRGYSATDIENILHRNWIRFLRNTWK